MLAGVLLVWGCTSANTGGEGSPCVSSGECASGLFCVHAACSSGLKGSTCDDRHACVDDLICRSDGSVRRICGGYAGDRCIVGDNDCVPGLLCIPTEPDNDDNYICALSGNGQVGSPCRVDGHCIASLVCVNRGACGEGWMARTSNVSGDLRDVHYANGRWVAVGGELPSPGEITTSTDGTTWVGQEISGAAILNNIHYADNQWRTVGRSVLDGMPSSRAGFITASTDGTMWTKQWRSVADASLLDIHYATDTNGANGLWVAVGRIIGIVPMDPTAVIVVSPAVTTSPTVTTSLNDVQWTEQQTGISVSSTFRDIRHANGLWVAVGDYLLSGLVITSADGTTWTERWRSDANGSLRDIQYLAGANGANGLWVAVGSDTDSMGNGIGGIITSTNGTNWTEQTSNVSGGLEAIHYADNLWVAVGGGGAITTSKNGTDWTARASNVSSRLRDIHYANNRWVAVGHNGVITTSTDGSAWKAWSSNVSSNLRAVHYDNNLWVAVGADGTVITADLSTTQ